MNFLKNSISIFLLTAIFLSVGCGQSTARSSSSTSEGALSAEQHFTLKDTQGQTVSLDGLLKSNKAVLINFWATWCPPCREEIPDLVNFHAKNKSKGFTVVGIDVGESSDRVATFAEKFKINYPLLLDKDQTVAESFRVVGIPTTLLINKNGQVLGVYHAFTDELVADVEKALA